MDELSRSETFMDSNQGLDPGLMDLNVLPQRYRRRKIKAVAVLPWVLWIALLALLYPIGTKFIQVERSFHQTQGEFQQMQTAVAGHQPLADEIEALESEIERTNQETEDIRSSLAEIEVESFQWSEMISLLRQETPLTVNLTGVTQSGNQMLVVGVSTSYQDILDMKGNLSAVDAFDHVQVDFIQRTLLEGPTPTPGAAGEGTQPTPAPTPAYSFQITIQVNEESIQP